MQTKDVTKLLGINRDRIKYFKKQGVFIPVISSPDSKSAEFSEEDIATLRKLVVLTKSGLTCGDIKKVQDGLVTLQEAIAERKRLIAEEMNRMRGSLLLAEELFETNSQYETLPTDYFWNEIFQKEQAGEKFMDVDDYRPVLLIRTIECPNCGAKQEIDLEDYLWDESSNDSRFDDDMGPDIVYSFNTEDNYECENCGKAFHVEGWIREYPIGAYDSEHIYVQPEV